MHRKIGCTALVVRDYDEAIRYYTEKLKFVLIEDTVLSQDKRWVLVAPSREAESCILLARASGAEQESCIGSQAGGRVGFFLHTDDFWRDYREMQSQGVEFLETPREEDYGTVAVFVDLYGNKWDLLEMNR